MKGGCNIVWCAGNKALREPSRKGSRQHAVRGHLLVRAGPDGPHGDEAAVQLHGRPHGHGGLLQLHAVQADLPARVPARPQQPAEDGVRGGARGQVLARAQGVWGHRLAGQPQREGAARVRHGDRARGHRAVEDVLADAQLSRRPFLRGRQPARRAHSPRYICVTTKIR